MADKLAAVQLAKVVFPVVPGGLTYFANFQQFAQQMLKIAGEGSSFYVMPIVLPAERTAR